MWCRTEACVAKQLECVCGEASGVRNGKCVLRHRKHVGWVRVLTGVIDLWERVPFPYTSLVK